jgi:hypothetical protein
MSMPCLAFVGVGVFSGLSYHSCDPGVHLNASENIMYLLMGLCFSISSLGLLAGAVWAYFKQRHQSETRLPATGTVVELVDRMSASGRSTFIAPVVEFTPPGGQPTRFTSDFGSRPAMHRLGQSVDVRYDPSEPQKAEIDSAASTWITPLILVFIGALACCLGVVFLALYAMLPASFSS